MTSPLLRGKIYSHKKFIFQDGGQADKLLILVNEPTGTTDWIFVKTTSQPKPKDTQGCHSTLNLYVLNPGEDFFRKKTWVQFHELYPLDHHALLQAKFDGDELRSDASLKGFGAGWTRRRESLPWNLITLPS